MTMRNIMLGSAIAMTMLVAVAIPVWAHHSFAAEFDSTKPITLRGFVTKVEWTNPHVWFYINVKDEAGKVTNWGAVPETAVFASMRETWYSRRQARS
jgi:hypothetical protein